MRLCYPLNDKPLFAYPVVPIQRLEWRQKSVVQKSGSFLFAVVLMIGWGYFVAVTSAHRWISWSEYGSSMSRISFWAGPIAVAVFALLVGPALYTFRAKYPIHRQHIFYREWAKLYTGYGKGYGPVLFFSEDLAGMEIRKASLADKTFYLLTVHFKPFGFLGRRDKKCGIDITSEAELRPLQDWARANQVSFILDPISPDQRRS